jgi:hypothetical protein
MTLRYMLFLSVLLRNAATRASGFSRVSPEGILDIGVNQISLHRLISRPASLSRSKSRLRRHVETGLPHSVSWSVDWIFQWRESLEDGVYAVPGSLIRAADNGRARFVGNRPGTELRWQANRHLWFQADDGVFYAGKFLKETQPDRNLNYWALWEGYKF